MKHPFVLAIIRGMRSLFSRSMIARLTRPSIARAAILPVAGVLAAIAGSSIVVLAANDRAETVANLLEKATLTAHVIAPNAAAAVWQFDTLSGERILQSLASDRILDPASSLTTRATYLRACRTAQSRSKRSRRSRWRCCLELRIPRVSKFPNSTNSFG